MSLVENNQYGRPAAARVLVVDDNEEVADCLTLLLTRLGYLARASYNAEQCLKSLRQFGPELLLLDLSLPVHDGFDICRAIRQSEGFQDLPIIACSALDPDVVEERSRGCNFSQHLVKPVSLKQLQAAIEEALGAGMLAAHH